VLDAGSGAGFFCRRLLARLPGLRYCGVESSASQVALARRLNPGVEFRHASFEELDFPPASFDRALLLETIGYCVDLDRLAQGLHRMLRPGGRVFVKNPGQKIFHWSDYRRHARFFDPVRREYGFDERAVGIVPDVDFIVKKLGLYGLELAREDYPYYNEYFYNASFYAPGFGRPVRMPERTTIGFDFAGFDPERSLSALGRRHPEYVEFHRRQAEGSAFAPRNRLMGCVVLVFERID
jgi:SAM-dependent methyltransferase